MQQTPTLTTSVVTEHTYTQVKWMTCLMFFVFAMTTDAVGVIIPEVVKQFDLSLTQAAAFHYVPMIFIGLSGLFLGQLADQLGRKKIILVGLFIYTLACFAFALNQSFYFYMLLLGLCGLSIGLFKTGALALIGDISPNTLSHTRLMNRVEGFFGLGAIVGPALVAILLMLDMAWEQLYLVAGLICAILLIIAWRMDYPAYITQPKSSIWHCFKLIKNPYALGFSLAIACYVATEVAVFVWLPTLLQQYDGQYTLLAAHAITVFFILRTIGRFLAEWLLSRFSWTILLAWFSTAIALCFVLSMWQGVAWALWLMPLSGLFMSMMYPTLNSKGISCFPRHQHGAAAGLILAFTALAAALGPLLMGIVGDIFGDVRYGFYLATGFALIMCVGLWWNHFINPAEQQLQKMSH
ncbi:MFS transporter [Arsukibacterium ikkense]|uniref:MFS transporter n=1 Tax=Arsukibacterium ikkense TaxID=336831 RepID=A0A0M2V615_9GAMM|nr:MFS transporter [Arsukibacterium ikkense]KKO45849.1 MFS transporter [Arsukibacterium ikkense]